PLQRLLDGPNIELRAAARLGRPVFLDTGATTVQPTRRQTHGWVFDKRVIAAEVRAQKRGGRSMALIRNHEQQVQARYFGRPERGAHFFERRLAAKRLAILILYLGLDLLGSSGQVTVHVVLEQFLQLRAALAQPVVL